MWMDVKSKSCESVSELHNWNFWEKSLLSSLHKENNHCFQSSLLTTSPWKQIVHLPTYFDKGTKGGKNRNEEKGEDKENNVMDKPISFHSICRPSTHTQELKGYGGSQKRRIESTVFPFSLSFVEFQLECVHTYIIFVLIKEEGWDRSEDVKTFLQLERDKER